MQPGMVGLRRMRANMVRRLLKGRQECVVFDVSPQAVGFDVRHISEASCGRVNTKADRRLARRSPTSLACFSP